ncbi:alpha/beta fold hydrolase [Salinispora arenicola]|uniref:alpha/beta fold hydrolase n=1 Tax=Salinispora arenicola TaxID=168697 RepID=UPI0003796AE6|nr:alpha/beta hydrolase [Salinispora arenicola]
MTTYHTVDGSGVRLRYEVRGSGPLMMLVASPMDAEAFAPVADLLADEYTVVTHDPRGISGSVLDDPEQDSTPELRAEDVVAIMDALHAETADVFGSSGGAVTGLALVTGWPGRVRTLVAHEPPLLELLPDAAVRRAGVDDVVTTFHRHGLEAAWMAFMEIATVDGADMPDSDGPPPEEPSPQEIVNGGRFFAHELSHTTRYVPDLSALRSAPTRVVVGIGAESGHLQTHRTSTALAELLGVTPVEFSGEHIGFLERPKEFANDLRGVLAGH